MDIAMLILTTISTLVACISLFVSISVKKDTNSIKKNKVKQRVEGNSNTIYGITEQNNGK